MKRIVLTLIASLLASSAYAKKEKESAVIPVNAPPSYAKECGECHIAFPPALLGAGDWKTIMLNLDKHYGDNAAIADEKQRQEISDFLVRNAGSEGSASGATSTRSPLPRLTATRWFRHEHSKISTTIWSGKQVNRASNCGACHMRADQGSFTEDEVRLPGDARRERP